MLPERDMLSTDQGSLSWSFFRARGYDPFAIAASIYTVSHLDHCFRSRRCKRKNDQVSLVKSCATHWLDEIDVDFQAEFIISLMKYYVFQFCCLEFQIEIPTAVNWTVIYTLPREVGTGLQFTL